MLVVDDIRTAKRHISTGLVIDTSVLRKLIPDLAHKSPITTQNQLLGTDDMLDLEQVIDVLGTAGRSTCMRWKLVIAYLDYYLLADYAVSVIHVGSLIVPLLRTAAPCPLRARVD